VYVCGKQADLKSTGENVVVGGSNSWAYSSFVNYDFFPSESFPILVSCSERGRASERARERERDSKREKKENERGREPERRRDGERECVCERKREREREREKV